MRLDERRVAARTITARPGAWPRIIPARHRATPGEAGFGASRFSSPARAFRVLYAAEDFATAFAEAVVRDRFQDRSRRVLYRPHLEALMVTTIGVPTSVALVDLTGSGAYELGIDTDAKGARAHDAG